MPVLSFPCAIHRPEGPARRRVWIKGHDLRTLALAATAQLGATADQCDYGIVWPDPAKASVLLEISHPSGDALVGPMAGPLPPPTLPLEEHFTLDTLLTLLGLEVGDGDPPGRPADRPGHYNVIVTYLPVWRPFPPARQARELEAQYRERCERTRIERSSRQGMRRKPGLIR